jgi:hypothetical protein
MSDLSKEKSINFLESEKGPVEQGRQKQEQASQQEKEESESTIVSMEKQEPIQKPKSRKFITASLQKGISGVVLLDKSETLKEIEKILSEGMEEKYKSLPDNLKQEFKAKGEVVASKIETLISQAKVLVYKVVKLILDWLLIVPGVNKFFMEQEAKIKAEKILNLTKNKK